MVITFHSPESWPHDPIKLLLVEQPHQQVQENKLMVITFHSPDPMKLLLLEQPHQQDQGDRLMGLHCLQSKNPENGIQFFILIYILVFYNKKEQYINPFYSLVLFVFCFLNFFINQLKNLVKQHPELIRVRCI